MADENMELDERKVKILDAVINYLATGEPGDHEPFQNIRI